MKNNLEPRRDLPKWKTTATRMVVQDKWLKLRSDTCLAPDGQTIDPWYVLEYPDWVNCLVVDKAGQAILLRHFRHGVDEYVTEIVAGGVESDESPEDAIKRELVEEIGYEGGELYHVGTSYANASSQTNRNFSFLALGGGCTQKPTPELGANFEMVTLPLTELLPMLRFDHPSPMLQTYHYAAIMMGLTFVQFTKNPSDAVASLRRALSI